MRKTPLLVLAILLLLSAPPCFAQGTPPWAALQALGEDEMTTYFRQCSALSGFMQHAYAQGIDVTRPDPRNPDSDGHYRAFQDRLWRLVALEDHLVRNGSIAERLTISNGLRR